jgi:hypothetical protein
MTRPGRQKTKPRPGFTIHRGKNIMQRLLLPLLAGLTLIVSATAQTIQWPVTPGQLEYSNFVFSITTQPASGGMAFHVTIAAKTGIIQGDSAAMLAMVTGSAAAPVVAGANPDATVTLKRTDTQWTADFTAPTALATNPAAFFVFVVTDYKTNPDGTRTYLSTDRMYEIRLRDFLTQ